jgi:hypothetical protein
VSLRLVHVVSQRIQYFPPLYRALAQRDGIKLTVLFGPVTRLDTDADKQR